MNLQPKTRRRLANSALVIVSVLVGIALVEGGARVLEIFDPLPPRTFAAFRLQLPPPPPYRNVDYDVATIVSEGSALKHIFDRTSGIMPLDFSGRYINVRGMRRVTTDVPPVFSHRIWLFGGSTMFCAEVPDEETIASQLQRLINTSGVKYRVENMAMRTAATRHQLWRLMNATDLNPGDIVVFLDGINDVFLGIHERHPDRSMPEANRRKVLEFNLAGQIAWFLYRRLGNRSVFVRRFLDVRTVAYESPPPSPEVVRRTAELYRENIRTAVRHTEERGVRFLHFLQPHIFSIDRRTAYEETLIRNPWITYPGVATAFAHGYPALHGVVARLHEDGIRSFDISNAFNSRDREIFLDFAHVNGFGNALAAKAIFDRLDLKP